MNAVPARPVRVLLAGFQHVFEVAAQLHRLGRLDGVHTLTAFGEDSWISHLARRIDANPMRRLRARILGGVPCARVHGHPLPELLAMGRRPVSRDPVAVMAWRNALFQREIPERAILSADAIVGFDTSSWILARRARDSTRRFFLEQTIAHPRSYRELLRVLRQRFPDWRSPADSKHDSLIALEEEEHALATVILAPSRFVARTLADHGVDPGKIRINPFGSRARRSEEAPPEGTDDRIRFLFAGTLGARKGLPVLLEAWKRLDPSRAMLQIVGSGPVPSAAKADAPTSISWLGRIPLDALHRRMAVSDVFVLPSFFEGLAMVLADAAALGLPIVATPASGAEEVVTEGENGWLIPEGDIDGLAQRLDFCIRHPEQVAAMRERAVALAATGKFSWDRYGERWEGILSEVLGSGC